MPLGDISFFRLYLVSCIYLHARLRCCFKNLFSEDAPLVEFMYYAFTHLPGVFDFF